MQYNRVQLNTTNSEQVVKIHSNTLYILFAILAGIRTQDPDCYLDVRNWLIRLLGFDPTKIVKSLCAFGNIFFLVMCGLSTIR